MDDATKEYADKLETDIRTGIAGHAQLSSLTDIEVTALAYALAQFMGSRDNIQGFFPAKPEDECFTVYWLRGDAIGSLTVSKAAGSDEATISGWFRSVDTVGKVDLSVEAATVNQAPVEVRPSATIHFTTDEESVRISPQNNDKSRKRAADFIRQLHQLMAREE